MPIHAHTEKHFTAGDALRDVVIGMADGLTVPFARSALQTTLVGGLAAVAAFVIARAIAQ